MNIEINAQSGNIEITLSVILHGRDGVFWLHGGEIPHVGAVAVAQHGGIRQLTVFAGHREDEIVGALTKRLERDGRLDHIVVCAGIHYDHIPKNWIPEIVSLCQTLGERFIERLDTILPIE